MASTHARPRRSSSRLTGSCCALAHATPVGAGVSLDRRDEDGAPQATAQMAAHRPIVQRDAIAYRLYSVTGPSFCFLLAAERDRRQARGERTRPDEIHPGHLVR